MNRTLASSLAMATAAAAAAAAMAILPSGNAYADDITIDNALFASGMSREEVRAQLKVPYPGGNPWSSQYNMFQGRTATTSEQVTSDYKRSRTEVSALTGEDSGSAYFASRAAAAVAAPGAAMGGPAR